MNNIYIHIHIEKIWFSIVNRKEKKEKLRLLRKNGNDKLYSVTSANRSLLILNIQTAFAVLLSTAVTL
jgi:hypothetical protein